MLRKTKSLFFVLSALFIAGCSTPTKQLHAEAQVVHLRIDASFDADDCEWLGEVTGSEGHWYSYLFYPNDVMVQGAQNDIKNRAKKLGANTVFMVNPQDFATSFTLMGNAYACPK